MKSNILIVEDHELTRFGLRTAFESVDFIENIYWLLYLSNFILPKLLPETLLNSNKFAQ